MERIALFAELGRRMRLLRPDAPVVLRACRENEWFTPDEVCAAVRALADELLAREALEAWTARYATLPVAAPRRVLVVMAGNIPLVGFFDLLCVLAAGHRCVVKPSAKDRVLVEYVVDQLRAIDPAVAVAWYDGRSAVDAVIATGSDNANRYFRTRYAGIPSLLRGHRQSVAVLSGRETPDQLAALSGDIWSYSGLGCRNVSLLLLPEGCDPPIAVPPLHCKYRNNYRQTRALLEMQGRPFRDLGGALMVDQQAFPTALSILSCARYRTLREAEQWLDEHDAAIQCVVSECVAHSRRVGFGRAQHPTLTDYADDRDTMAWLAAL